MVWRWCAMEKWLAAASGPACPALPRAVEHSGASSIVIAVFTQWDLNHSTTSFF
jgi:hypothetical protein